MLSDPEKRAAYDQLGRGYQPGQDFRPPLTGTLASSFPARGFHPGKPPASAISSPNCLAAWAAPTPALATRRRLSGAGRGPPRQGAARTGRRLQRRHPADYPARAENGCPQPGATGDPHPQRENPQRCACRPGDPPRGPERAGNGRRTRERPVAGSAVQAASALPRGWARPAPGALPARACCARGACGRSSAISMPCPNWQPWWPICWRKWTR